jgi:hypothetical protein
MVERPWDRRGRDRMVVVFTTMVVVFTTMVVVFTTNYAISDYHH